MEAGTQRESVRQRIGAALRQAGRSAFGLDHSLRWAVLRAMLATTLLAVLVISAYHQFAARREAERYAGSLVSVHAANVVQQLDAHLSGHRATILALAAAVSALPPTHGDRLDPILAGFHDATPGFISMMVTDERGVLRAVSPRRTQNGQPALQAAASVADRDYFREAVRTRRPYLSPVFRGRGIGQDPIVAISAPVIRAGVVAGVAEGSLNVSLLEHVSLPDLGRHGFRMLVLDGADKVVYASGGLPFRPLEDAAAADLVRTVRRAGGTPFRYTSGGAEHLSAGAISSQTGWSVVVQQPVAPFEDLMRRQRNLALLALTAVVLLSGPMAGMIAARFTRPLEQLADAVSNFELKGGSGAVPDPVQAPREVRALIQHWGQLETRLRESYDSLQSTIEELGKAKLKAQEANRTKSRFLANMSHELRTPLSAVIGMTDLLLGDELTPEQHEQALLVRQSAGSLLRIIDDLLDVVRVETGKLSLQVGRFNVHELVAGATLPHFRTAAAKGVATAARIGDSVPRWLEGDEQRLRQILLNLVGNAVKFTNHGSVELTVKAQPVLDGRVKLSFEVADTGIGMADEQQARVFEPFYQADSSHARSFGGVGLGLAISRQLAGIMGGEVGVRSKPGEGSAFWLRVPLRVVAGLAGSGSAADAEATVDGKLVLLAEDNPVNQRVAQKMLQKLGYKVELAANGERAVEAAVRCGFGAILMDCQMPVMDGYDAAREIRLRLGAAAPPIIALTANALPQDRQRCLDAGMSDYLAKPVDLAAMAEMLQRWTSEAERPQPRSPASA